MWLNIYCEVYAVSYRQGIFTSDAVKLELYLGRSFFY